jgi:hypothetical protein
MNVEVGTTLGLEGAGMLRIGDGDETGWGINEGKAPPRLFGGVMCELEEKVVEAHTARMVGALEGGDEEESDKGEDVGLKETALGIEDGDAGRGIIDGEAG